MLFNMADHIKVEVTRRELKFAPIDDEEQEIDRANSEDEFDVYVTNNSNQLASFQLELLAAGVKPSSGLKWYRIEPQSGTKKPPGQTTKFSVKIIKAPIPAYNTTIDLTLKVFSVEFEELFNEQRLKLEIREVRRSFRINLPIKDFRGMPGDTVEIPLLVYNLSSKNVNVTLTFLQSDLTQVDGANDSLESTSSQARLNPSWFKPRKGYSIEQTLPIAAGDLAETSFQCQIPASVEAYSQRYPFRIEARSDTGGYQSRGGSIEILPWGAVEWHCPTLGQSIPDRRIDRAGRRLKRRSNAAVYNLTFGNRSNLPQRIQLHVSNRQQCGLIIPDPIELEPDSDATQTVPLTAQKRQPLIGREQRLLFRVFPELTALSGEPSSIRPDPTVQLFELRVKPLIPVIWQLAAFLLLLLLLWFTWLLNPVSHSAPVNSVRLIENGYAAISGSTDGTVRRWRVDEILGIPYLTSDRQLLANLEKPVRVVSQKPERDSQIAVGLGNGDLELWDVSQRRGDPSTIQHQDNDRVFGLDFTKDSKFLFSGHSSGFIRQWELKPSGAVVRANPSTAYPRFAISALAISESQTAPEKLAIAGERYNKLALWDWNSRKLYDLKYEYQEPANLQAQPFAPVSSQQDYIESLAINDQKNLLVTADSNGYTTLWDMRKIRECITQADTNGATDGLKSGTENKLFKLSCNNNPIQKQWYGGVEGQSGHLRSVALSQNGCYLTRVGDDGRVMVWRTREILERPDDAIEAAGEDLNQQSISQFWQTAKLNSVDIHAFNDHVLVVTGDDRHRVRAFRTTRMDSSCKPATSPA